MALNTMNRQWLYKTLKKEVSRPRALALLVLLMAIVGLYRSMLFESASLDYYYVRNAIEQWHENPQSVSLESYNSVKESIIDAKNNQPSNALYHDLNGQVLEWGVSSGFEPADRLKDVKKHYLQATKMRPAWPVTWASLAMVKWRMQELDDETLFYLERAHALGKMKPEVHMIFAELGLALYGANHPFYANMSENVRYHVLQGLKSKQSRDRVWSAIERYDQKDAVCRWNNKADKPVSENILNCQE